MKQVKLFSLRPIFFLSFLMFSLISWAQDSGETQSSTTTTTTRSTDVTTTTEWYTQPWVWIVGAAVFILLLVALLKSSRGRDTVSTSDRVTVKKTIEKDNTGTDV